jgi:hypothetical protein
MNRKTLIAGAVFAGLIIVAVLVTRSPEKGSRKEGEAPRPVAKVAPGGIDTVEVTKAGVTTVIKKDGANYKVEKPVPYAADQEAAKQAFEGIEKLEFDGIVSDQKAKHDEFEVGANSVRVVGKKGDKTLVDLRIGKVANNQTMVRVEGKDEVWQAVGSLKYEFDKDAAAWRDKSITTFTEADAERIEVNSKSGGKIVLTKPAAKDGGAGRRRVDGGRVDGQGRAAGQDRWLPASSRRSTPGRPTTSPTRPSRPTPASTPPRTPSPSGSRAARRSRCCIGKKKGEEDYYVKTADSPQVFLVKKYNLERVNKRPVEFREKTMCNLNEGEITEVTVNRDKDSFTLVKQPARPATTPGS